MSRRSEVEEMRRPSGLETKRCDAFQTAGCGLCSRCGGADCRCGCVKVLGFCGTVLLGHAIVQCQTFFMTA